MYACQLILAYGYIERKLKVSLKNFFCNDVILGDYFFFPLRGQSNLFGGEDSAETACKNTQEVSCVKFSV